MKEKTAAIYLSKQEAEIIIRALASWELECMEDEAKTKELTARLVCWGVAQLGLEV